MGWTHTRGAGKKEIKEEIRAGFTGEWKLIADRIVGNHFWTVAKSPNQGTMIVLFLLRKNRGFGWGYKDMEESMGPYYFSCPKKYLDMVPLEVYGGNASWREQVAEHHQRSAEKRRVRRLARQF